MSLALVLLANLFLGTLMEDPYQVVIHQRQIFIQWEQALPLLAEKTPSEHFSKESNLTIAQALYKAANIYRRLGTEQDLKLALYYHEKALSIRNQYLDKYALEKAESFIDLGAAYNELKGKNNNRVAIKHYLDGITIYEHHGIKALRYVASAFNNLANSYRDLDDKHIPLAITYQQRALEIFTTFPNDTFCQEEKAKVLYNQGVNFHKLKKNNEATESLNEAKKFFTTTNDYARYAITLSYLGLVYSNRGKDYQDKAVGHLEEALSIQQNLYGENHPETQETIERLNKLS